jgi:hypothetical protein
MAETSNTKDTALLIYLVHGTFAGEPSSADRRTRKWWEKDSPWSDARKPQKIPRRAQCAHQGMGCNAVSGRRTGRSSARTPRFHTRPQAINSSPKSSSRSIARSASISSVELSPGSILLQRLRWCSVLHNSKSLPMQSTICFPRQSSSFKCELNSSVGHFAEGGSMGDERNRRTEIAIPSLCA